MATARIQKDIDESEIHFKLYAHIHRQLNDEDYLFNQAIPEKKLASKKRADIVLYSENKPLVVIECKKYQKTKINRKIDPLSSDVVIQAMTYAAEIGAPYFITYNGSIGALFQTHQDGIGIFDRNYRIFKDINHDHSFFSEIINEAVKQASSDALAWSDLDERFVGRMASMHSVLQPEVAKILLSDFDSNKNKLLFRQIREWFESFGVEWDENDKKQIRENRIPAFATQASYILLDKLLFYKVLENKYPKLPKLTKNGNKSIFQQIDKCFDAVLKIDYVPIFHPDDLFSQSKFFKSSEDDIIEFVHDLSNTNIDKLDGDLLGQIYEKLIPPDTRHRLGQYYTPPDICALLSCWAIESSSDSVLDPACGSGGFLNSAYNRIQQINPEIEHEEILDRLHGIEINRFPAHLSAMNLALKNLSSHTNFINITVKDFFNSEVHDSVGTAKVDAIVGNPPYIRQELIADKDRCREHLSNEANLSNRSDIYIYFITKSLKMLKEGGRLSFIISNRWLMTDYGDRFQKHLLEISTPEAFVIFDKNVFSDALIGTVCIFIRPRSHTKGKKKNLVKFIRIKENMNQKDILNLIKRPLRDECDKNTKSYTLIARSIETLKSESSSWRSYLYAPDLFHKVKSSEKLTKISSIGSIVFGIKTGCNSFFYLKDEDIHTYGLDRKYFKPLLKSVGQLESTDFTKNDTEWRLLDVGKYIEQAKKEVGNFDHLTPVEASEKVINWLKDNGHTSLANYIVSGEDRNFHKVPSVRGRKIWWDLGKLEMPDFAITKEVWREHRTPILKDGMICDQHLYPVYLNKEHKKEREFIGALLNSNFMWLMREVIGREASGQAMSRNELTVQEAKNLLMPDPKIFTHSEKLKLSKAFSNYTKFDRKQDYDKKEMCLEEIDTLILKKLNLGISHKELIEAVSFCLERRVAAGHLTSGLMIEEKHQEMIEEIKAASKAGNRRKSSHREKVAN